MKLSILGALACAVPLLWPYPAIAGSNRSPQETQRHAERAQLQYDMGHWDVALAEFEAAYASSMEPLFLYKMAETSRRKGDAQRALDLYKNYQEKAPENPQKAEVDEKIRDLTRQLSDGSTAMPVPVVGAAGTERPATLEAAPNKSAENGAVPSTALEATDVMAPPATAVIAPAKPAPALRPVHAQSQGAPQSPRAILAPSTFEGLLPSPQKDDESRGKGLKVAGAILTGVGLGGIGVGCYYSLQTKSIESSVNNASRYDSNQYDSGKQAEKLQWLFYGAGAGMTTLGLVLYIVGASKHGTTENRVNVAPEVGLGSAGLTARGAF